MVVEKKSGTVSVRFDKKLTKRVKSVEMTGKTKSVNFPSTKLDFVGGGKVATDTSRLKLKKSLAQSKKRILT